MSGPRRLQFEIVIACNGLRTDTSIPVILRQIAATIAAEGIPATSAPPAVHRDISGAAIATYRLYWRKGAT